MLYTFYGDDFTGSTDVLGTLASAGVCAALFLKPPSASDLAEFPGLQAAGVAGDSRSRTPQWMNDHLPAIFAALKRLDATVTHYKTCSTFDSAPHIGNIGRAMELGAKAFDTHPVPIVVGSPRLRRYVVSSTLFAAADDAVYRIDRHPTMSKHPVTPMLEADLRRHLKLQTDMRIGSPASDADAWLYDTFDEASLRVAGAAVWQQAQAQPIFAVGSSGLTDALLTAWNSEGLLREPGPLRMGNAVEQMVVISGSCSPATQGQIEWAIENGFDGIEIEPSQLMSDPKRYLERSARSIAAGRSPILYIAPGGPMSSTPIANALDVALGSLLRQLIEDTSIRRVVICGGDTSSHVVQQLPIRALTFQAPLIAGVPICSTHARGTRCDGLELILKGGQMGAADFLSVAMSGGQ